MSGFGGVGYPKLVPEAIAAGPDRELTVVSGGGVGGEIDTQLIESGDMRRRYPFQTRPSSRTAINHGELAFHDRHISQLADEVRAGGLRHGFSGETIAVIEAVAIGEEWLIPSTSIGHTPAFVAAADRLIVEVNRSQPRELARVHDVYLRDLPPQRAAIPLPEPTDRIGSPVVEFAPDQLAAVVETDRPDDPYEFRDPGATDREIAANLRAFLSAELDRNPVLADSLCLQFGVGSLGNALMSAVTELNIGDRELVYFGEVVQDGLLDMLDSGQLRGASATSLALSEDGQRRLFDDIGRYADDIVLRPGDISNAPSLINRFGVVGINSAVEVDLYGNVNATHLNGTHVVNGIGGGGDFARNCRLGVIALPATAGDGDISRIVPMASHVDHTEHDVSVILTEHGVADLRGKSPRERAAAIIDIAGPESRDELAAYRDQAESGQDAGNTPHDLDEALSWHQRR